MTIRIMINNWIVSAICKEIQTGKVAICTQQIDIICVNKPTNLRIIITAGYIVEFCLGVVVVASVPQRVNAGHIAGRGEELAPGVVGVGGDAGSAAVQNAHDVALQVGQVVVGDGRCA